MRMPPWSGRILAGPSLVSVLVLAACTSADSQPQPELGSSCHITGCSAELCTDRPDIASSCIYRAEFACYHEATCERQADSHCDWTPTPELEACLAAARGAKP